MVEALAKLERGKLDLSPQAADGATYARKIDKAETRVVWSRPAKEIHNLIRALSPAPGAWCEIELAGRRERIKLLRSAPAEGAGRPGEVLDDRLTVACGEGAVRIEELQRAGGKPLAATDFLRGLQSRPERLQ